MKKINFRKTFIVASIFKKIITVAFLLGAFSSSSEAFLSHGYNIEQLSSKANLIFMGEVMQVTESTTGNIPYIEVRFNVFESFKGNVSASYTLKQFAPKVGKQLKLIGMGKDAYVVGQKLVMFLGTPSSASGLSAPEDFQLFMLQTKSRRQNDIDGSIVLNKQFSEKIGLGLFQNLQRTKTKTIVNKMPAQTKNTPGGVTFKDFRNLIQASVE